MIWKTQPRSSFGGLAAIFAGSGPTVVLIHGVGLRAEAWGAQIPALAQTHSVIAVDLPGHGSSPMLGDNPTLSTFSDAFADALPAGPVAVIGHSFGAMIALDLAQRHPENVTAVAALNAVYRRNPSARAAVIARADSLDGVRCADPNPPLDRWFGPAASPARAACHNWLTAVDPAGYRAAYQCFAHADGPSDAGLRGLRCAALFMTGADEPNSTPDMSTHMARLAPMGRAAIIANAAHMMPMTHATEVNSQLSNFLAGRP